MHDIDECIDSRIKTEPNGKGGWIKVVLATCEDCDKLLLIEENLNKEDIIDGPF